MIHKTLSYISLLICLLFFGCISEFNADISVFSQDILVVEGNIVSNEKVTFYFSKTVALNSDLSGEDYKNVEVSELCVVGSNNYCSEKAFSMGNGSYQLNIGDLDDSFSYWIEFIYDGHSYSSRPSQPTYTPEIDSLSWTQPEIEGKVNLFVSTHTDKIESTYFLWTYDEDWEYVPAYRSYLFFDPDRRIFYESFQNWERNTYYCWKKAKGREILIGTTETLKEGRIINHKLKEYEVRNERFYVLYSILVKQRCLSKEAYEYYQNKLKVNQDMTGLFTPQPSEIQSNIDCLTDPSRKVIGFVDAAMNVVEKRLFVDANDLTKPLRGEECAEWDWELVEEIMASNQMSYMDIYKYYDLRPYNNLGGDPPAWHYAGCVDCTFAGGTKDKPDFWPNDHK